MEIKRLIKTGSDTATITMHTSSEGYYLNITNGHQNFIFGFKDIRSCATCFEVADENLIKELGISFAQHNGMVKISTSLN